ncbi:transposase [Caldibacillus thermoamylovorans]|uniref:transposase n=1 Tax=Caldibacillus thermoamylovorans TaxID=35841 RepID=UPI0005B72807|nr:transposase [Caldibacillus thermoamylovorans]KIO63175.1 hypothetical protein B4166_3069 [Caldibacillus thermoamylovorans]
MAIIPQLSLFAWEEIEELGDLERLRLVIEYMPDEQLMRVLEKERGKGRDDYPIRAMWNALWKREYNKRTAVERVNSRIDQVFGFENHTIRGIKKMTVRCGLALCVMLAMALGRIKEKQAQNMRSLVCAV